MAGTEGNISMFIADNGFAAKCNTCYRLFIYASNEPKSVPARDPGDCRDNYKKLAKRVSYSCSGNI